MSPGIPFILQVKGRGHEATKTAGVGFALSCVLTSSSSTFFSRKSRVGLKAGITGGGWHGKAKHRRRRERDASKA